MVADTWDMDEGEDTWSDRVDESRRRTCELGGKPGWLGARAVEDGGDTCRAGFVVWASKPRADGLVVSPQNHRREGFAGLASKPGWRSRCGRTTRGGIGVLALRLSNRWQGAVAVGSEHF